MTRRAEVSRRHGHIASYLKIDGSTVWSGSIWCNWTKNKMAITRPTTMYAVIAWGIRPNNHVARRVQHSGVKLIRLQVKAY